jgi:putative redox protein
MATTRDPHEEAKMTVSAEARVVVSTGEGLRTEVSTGGHTGVADEPESLGGTDEGPTPYDYLLAALGGCTAMTLRMYADRKGWPLEAVTVRLSHDRIHAKDCGECETEEGRIDRIEREIEMVGPLDEKQRRRLLEVADMCPVHRTLKGEVLVENSLVG